MSNLNPYEPILNAERSVSHPSFWSIIFAGFSATLGIASAGIGFLVLIETIDVLSRQSFDIDIVYGLVASAAFLTFGAASIAAARLHWKQRHRFAGTLVVAAFVVSFPVLAFLITN